MRVVMTNNLKTEQKQSLHRLWNQVYPSRLSHAQLIDFEKYLYELEELEHHLLIDEAEEIMGWGFRFTRDRERWFGLLLQEELQGQGYGAFLLNRMKAEEEELNGWVIYHNKELRNSGQAYRSPLGFYLKQDFVVFSDVKMNNDYISAVKVRWKNHKT